MGGHYCILVAEAPRGCPFSARMSGHQILEVALDFSGRSQGSQQQELESSSSLRMSLSAPR